MANFYSNSCSCWYWSYFEAISNSIGAKEDKKAMYVAINSSSNSYLDFCNFIWFKFIDELLKIMGSTEESIILTREYLDIIFFGAIIVVVQLSLNGTLNAQGDTKSYRNVLIFTFFLNIFLNPLFIFGYGFIPAFGIAGLAIATLVSVYRFNISSQQSLLPIKKYLYLEYFKPKFDYISTLLNSQFQ